MIFKKKRILESYIEFILLCYGFIAYASHINLLLTYYKFVDLKKDGSALLGTLGCMALYRQFKKARRNYPEKAEAIEKNLKALDVLERQRCDRIDEAAEPFANLMAEILFYPGMDFDKGAVSALKHLAYNLGRFIYIIDAYDDIEKDIRSGNYNPLLAQYKYGSDEGGPQIFKDKVREPVAFNLTFTLSEIDRACDSLDFKKNRGIIENVVKIGLYKELERITRGDKACKTRMKF